MVRSLRFEDVLLLSIGLTTGKLCLYPNPLSRQFCFKRDSSGGKGLVSLLSPSPMRKSPSERFPPVPIAQLFPSEFERGPFL